MTVRPLFVIKLGGALLDDSPALSSLLDGVAAMHRAGPGCVLLVHGGGSAVDRHLARLGLETRKRDGIRLTPPEQMIEIAGVLRGSVNATLIAHLHARGVNAVGLSLADGATTEAQVTTQFDFDPGCVGEITSGDPRLIQTLLSAEFLPVVSSIAAARDGTLLNVNADDAAAALARILNASGLVFLTDVSGVHGSDGQSIQTLTTPEVEELISKRIITGGMIPKVRGALATAESIGVPVIITTWRDATVLPRLAAGESVGTSLLPTCATVESSLTR